MTGDFWVYSDSLSAANEALTAANEIANSMSARAVMIELDAARDGVASSGFKLVIKAGSPLGAPELAAEAIFRAAKDARPSAVLVGSTRNGREVASRLAVKMEAGCLSDVSKLKAEGGRLSGERSEYAGKSQTRVVSELPCLATVKAGAYSPAQGGGGETKEVQVGDVSGKSRAVSTSRKPTATVDLRAAKIIVAAGRGVKKKDDLAIIDSLARAMGGTLGCSRPLSSDLGWLPEEYHIGLTGLNVKPELYVAVGISGQLQHVAGMKDSRVVAAVNSDKDAPIFQAADYGVVGDLYQVVPALQKALAARR